MEKRPLIFLYIVNEPKNIASNTVNLQAFRMIRVAMATNMNC